MKATRTADETKYRQYWAGQIRIHRAAIRATGDSVHGYNAAYLSARRVRRILFGGLN